MSLSSRLVSLFLRISLPLGRVSYRTKPTQAMAGDKKLQRGGGIVGRRWPVDYDAGRPAV
jgi:hypothetical protein